MSRPTAFAKLHAIVTEHLTPHYLTRGDLKMLYEFVRDECPDHSTCEFCHADLCETCGIGEFSTCDGDYVHCLGCWANCRQCQLDELYARNEQMDSERGLA